MQTIVAAIIIENGKVLATQRGCGDFKDGWEFSGGKVADERNRHEIDFT